MQNNLAEEELKDAKKTREISKKSCEVAFSRLLLAGIPTFNRKTAHDVRP
jgi:hypothetical protein